MATAAAAAPAAPPREFTLSGVAMILAGMTVGLANFMVQLDATIANVSVEHISGSLGIARDQGTWVITSYSVAEAITVPLTGWLAQRFGTVRLVIFSLLGFCLFSALCGTAWSLGMLVVCRIGQGLCGGPLLPLCQTLLLRVFPQRLRGQATAIWAMTTVVAPVLGPVLGGYISDNLSWHWIFLINLPFGMLCLFGVVTLLSPFETETSRPRIDRVGLVLLVVWIACLQIMLDVGREHDWFGSPMIVALAIGAAVFFVLFVIWELTEAHPVVDLRVFRHRGYTSCVISIGIIFGSYFAGTVVIPQWLQGSLGYTATWSGYVTAWMGVFAFISSPIVGRLVGRVDARILVTFGIAVTAIATLLRANWTTGADYWTLAIPQLFAGAGAPWFFIPLSVLALASVEPSETTSAAGLMAFVRTLSAAVATSFATSVWFDHQQTRQAQLVDIVHNSPDLTTQLADRGISAMQARQLFSQLVEQESVTLATRDIFWLSLVLFVIATALVWAAPKPARVANAGSGH